MKYIAKIIKYRDIDENGYQDYSVTYLHQGKISDLLSSEMRPELAFDLEVLGWTPEDFMKRAWEHGVQMSNNPDHPDDIEVITMQISEDLYNERNRSVLR